MTNQTNDDMQTTFKALLAELRASTEMDETEWIETQISGVLARLGFDPDALPIQTFLYDIAGASARAMLQEDLALRDTDIEMM